MCGFTHRRRGSRPAYGENPVTAESAGIRVSKCDGADLLEASILGVQREASKAGSRPCLRFGKRPDAASGFQRRMRVCIVVVAAIRWV